MINSQNLSKLLAATRQHGEKVGSPQMTIEHLQALMYEAWVRLPPSAQESLLQSGAAQIPGLDTQGLVASHRESLDSLVVEMEEAGVTFLQGDMGWFWESDTEEGRYFDTLHDAVKDASQFNHTPAPAPCVPRGA